MRGHLLKKQRPQNGNTWLPTGSQESNLEKLSLIFAILRSWFFGGSGVWTQSLALGRHVLYHLSHIPNLFCFSYCFK
jgi:hypothetical protein